MSTELLHSFEAMGTVVSIHVVGHAADRGKRREWKAGVARAVEWFGQVEETCSRFDPGSELRRLSDRICVSVEASPMLYELVDFSVRLAEETRGAFDPTVGLRMQEAGFDRDYRTGEVTGSSLASDGPVSYRDVLLNPERRRITLRRPLVLDLGAAAKGLAIDLAARELAPFGDFAIDAGGDLYLAGHNASGTPWSVGIRHPRDASRVLRSISVSDVAVCTSGDYERPSPRRAGDHHILDPRTSRSAAGAASVTVVAPSALVADALGTAAFVLGPESGLELLERHGVGGLIVTPDLEQLTTRWMTRSDAPIQVSACADA